MVKVAGDEVGVREVGGRNRGPRVEEYQLENGGIIGESWCADFVCYVLRRSNGLQFRHSRRALGLWEQNPGARRGEPRPGFVFVIDHGGGLGHCGFVTQVGGGDFDTIEGNTNEAGSREGDGVYRKTRRIAECLGFLDFGDETPGAVPQDVA